MGHPEAGEGSPTRLGSVFDGEGVTFALSSGNASAVELCLFDPDGRESARLPLPGRTDDVWHGRVAGLRPGQLYGYRVHGPWRPADGHRFNPHKLLIDPYARGMSGRLVWHDATHAFAAGSPEADLGFDGRDSAPYVPRSVVVNDVPAPAHRRPGRAWSETVIYEAHVKGLTRLHPEVPEALRGRYAALGHPAVIRHLLDLGVTAIQLLPIQAFADDRFLVERGLSNYWGYSTLNYFTPEARFGSAAEFRDAVRMLHEAGIEVILDIVLNHTVEADHLGPTLCFRGIDNAGYYRLRPDDPRYDENWTGCGNTLDFGRPRVVRLAVDALRHWAEAYGVDGFRFDLGPVLGRDPVAFDPQGAFFAAVAEDRVLSGLKLIAEPWDLGPDGYRLGQFPPGWRDWNDRFRDAARGFWRGDPGQVRGLVQGLAGSREIFGPAGRPQGSSVNYVCSHDGFTLADLVSYEGRHNVANGEGNRDGHGHNLSCNHGIEGRSEDPGVRAVRARHVRNLLATVFLAQGVPMLLAGDELSRSQGGNNNAYCQDNATSWLDWEAGRAADPDLPAFLSALSALRRDVAALRRPGYFEGAVTAEGGRRDVHWLAPGGAEMAEADWLDPDSRAVGMQFGNDSPDGRRLLLLANAMRDPVSFRLPAKLGGPWRRLLDTALPRGTPLPASSLADSAGTFIVGPRSLVLFEHAS